MQELLDMINQKEHEWRILDKVEEVKPPVEIIYNKNKGKYCWAVQVCGTEFLVDVFKTKDEVIEYCNEERLPIEQVIE